MGAGGSFEYVAKFVEEDPDLDSDEQQRLAAYVREHKITGKRAKRRFMNDKSALEEIAGPKGPLANYGLVADPELGATQKAVADEATLSM